MKSVFRHPLLAPMMWPLAALNEWQMEYTRYNLAVFLMAALLVVATLYAFRWLLRILCELVGLGRGDGLMLTTLFFSLAYVMVTMVAPDHFGLSLPLLLYVLYKGVQGRRKSTSPQREVGRGPGGWLDRKSLSWSLLFLLVGGITVTNGVKVWMAAYADMGRRLLAPRRLLWVVVVPVALLVAACCYQNEAYVKPHALAGQIQAARNAERDTTLTARSEARKRMIERKNGRPVSHRPLLEWTNMSLSRTESVVENLLGESLQLHRRHLLEDIFGTRPIIVRYDWPVCYMVEVVIALLVAVGIWCGRRERLLWLVLGWVGFDMLMHVGLGFGLNEVYIMTTHWAFVIPIAMGYALRAARGRVQVGLRVLVMLLTLWLLSYNGWLFTKYLLA